MIINYKLYFHAFLLLILVDFSVSAQQLSKVVDPQIGSQGKVKQPALIIAAVKL